jgi:hypothetical protein
VRDDAEHRKNLSPAWPRFGHVFCGRSIAKPVRNFWPGRRVRIAYSYRLSRTPKFIAILRRFEAADRRRAPHRIPGLGSADEFAAINRGPTLFEAEGG